MKYIMITPIKLTFFIVFFSIFISLPNAYSDELMGQEIFVAECVGCHMVKLPGESAPVKELLAEKAPSLVYAGSKFKSSFLLNWLVDPEPIRPLKYNSLREQNMQTHKRLTMAQAEDVTRYLMTLQLIDTRPMKEEPLIIEPKVTILAKQLFSQRYSCYSCHQVREDKRITGGLSGPSLISVGERLNPLWIYTFLKNPREVTQRGSMPTYAGIISDNDLLELTKYLATFK